MILKTSVAILLHPQYQICCTSLVSKRRSGLLLNARSLELKHPQCYSVQGRTTVFSVRLFAPLDFGRLERIFLSAVVPAWSVGTQVHMDVFGRIAADLMDAGSPCRHDGCDAVIVG